MKYFLGLFLLSWAFSTRIKLSNTNINNILYTYDDTRSVSIFRIKYNTNNTTVAIDKPDTLFKYFNIVALNKTGDGNLKEDFDQIELNKYKVMCNFTGNIQSIIKLSTNESLNKEENQDWVSNMIEYLSVDSFEGFFYLYFSTITMKLIKFKMKFRLKSSTNDKYILDIIDVNLIQGEDHIVYLYKERNGEINSKYNNESIDNEFRKAIFMVDYNKKSTVFLSNLFPKDNLSQTAIEAYINTHFTKQVDTDDNGSLNISQKDEKEFLKVVCFVLVLVIILSFIWVTIKYKSLHRGARIQGIYKNSIIKLD